jgi:hypothetical protein
MGEVPSPAAAQLTRPSDWADVGSVLSTSLTAELAGGDVALLVCEGTECGEDAGGVALTRLFASLSF